MRPSWRRAPAPARASTSSRTPSPPRRISSSGEARAAPRASSSTGSSRLRGIGTVATGTLWSGSIGDGDVLGRRARRPRGAGPLGPGSRSAGRAGGVRSAGRGLAPGRRPRRAPPWGRPRRARLLPDELPARRGARGARGDSRRHASARPPRDGRALRDGSSSAATGMRSSDSRAPRWPREVTTSCSGKARPSGAESSSTRRRRAARPPSEARGSSAARSPPPSTSRCAWPSSATCSTASSRASRQAGEWVFSRAWLDDLEAGLRARIARGRSSRSRRPAACGAVGDRRRPAARPGAARLEALPPRRRAPPSATARLWRKSSSES